MLVAHWRVVFSSGSVWVFRLACCSLSQVCSPGADCQPHPLLLLLGGGNFTIIHQLDGNYQCMKLMALREQVISLKVADLEKLKQSQRFEEQTLRGLPKQSCSCADSSSVVMSENFEVYEGCDPLEGTFSLGNRLIYPRTKDTPGKLGI